MRGNRRQRVGNAVTKRDRPGGLQTIDLSQSWRLRVWDQGAAWPSEGPFRGAGFSLRPHVAEGTRSAVTSSSFFF